jgi:hypothetical protein
MQQLAAAINAVASAPFGINARVFSAGQGADLRYGVELSGAAGVGFTVTGLTLSGAAPTSGTLLLSSGSLKPQVAADQKTAQAGTTEGDSLDGQIVAVSVAAAATGGIAVGAAVVNNTMSTQNSLTLGATSNQTQPLANPSLRSSADLKLLSQGRNRINRTQAISVTGAGGATFAVAAVVNTADAVVDGSTRTLVNGGSLRADQGQLQVQATAENTLESSAYGGQGTGSGTASVGFGYFQARSTLGRSGGDPELEARLGDDVIGRAGSINLSSTSQIWLFCSKPRGWQEAIPPLRQLTAEQLFGHLCS